MTKSEVSNETDAQLSQSIGDLEPELFVQHSCKWLTIEIQRHPFVSVHGHVTLLNPAQNQACLVQKTVGRFLKDRVLWSPIFNVNAIFSAEFDEQYGLSAVRWGPLEVAAQAHY